MLRPVRVTHRSAPRASVRFARLAPWIVAVAAIALAFGWPRHAGAAAFDVADGSWEGCSELLEIARNELGQARVVPVAVLDWDQIRPEDGILALHPLRPMNVDDAQAFMKAGGRLAIVDDFGRGDETLRRFSIDRVPAPSRPQAALRNRPALAIAEPVIDVVAGRATGPHPVVANVQKLITNHPTGLIHPNLSPVLHIRAIGEPNVVIAVAGQVGKGRLFAMSDPSAVINQMLRYPGNRAFALGLVRYLVDDDGPMLRRGKLYVVANRFEEHGAYGGEATLGKELESLLRSISDALEEARTKGFPPWAHVVIAILVVAGAAFWAIRTAARTYKAPVPRYARRVPLVSQGGAAGRFAVLAAPSSQRGLVLLEMKSALFEAVSLRFHLEGEPTPDVATRLLAGILPPALSTRLGPVIEEMVRAESAVIGRRAAHVSLPALRNARDVVNEVVAVCTTDVSAAPLQHAA